VIQRGLIGRGQPLIAFGAIMAMWVGARVAFWQAPVLIEPVRLAEARVLPFGGERHKVKPHHRAKPTIARKPGEFAPPRLTAPELERPALHAEPLSPRVAAGQQLLWLAGMAELPLPPEAAAAHWPDRPAPAPTTLVAAPQAAPTFAALQADRKIPRWSVDGWLLWRPQATGLAPGAAGTAYPSGLYGGSQAGLVARYHLAPASPLDPRLYLRATSALHHPRGEELAAGLAVRPVARLPISLMVEARVTHGTAGTVVRPALAAVSELPPATLPLGLKGEVYVQAGWVGGKDHTPFIDGQARAQRVVARGDGIELRVGAGAWGGAQRGASRLDLGPSATLAVPIGTGGGRLSADYRFRVAGDAAPGNGPAITLSAGF